MFEDLSTLTKAGAFVAAMDAAQKADLAERRKRMKADDACAAPRGRTGILARISAFLGLADRGRPAMERTQAAAE